MLNKIKLNKPSKLLTKGIYSATLERTVETKDKVIFKIKIDNNIYNVWLDGVTKYECLDGELRTPLEMAVDALMNQLFQKYEEKLQDCTEVEEVLLMAQQQNLSFQVWCTVYEDKLNNFSFRKPARWDAEELLEKL